MKKALAAILILFTLKSQAQDTTKIYNLSLPARLVEYLVPSLASPSNDEYFSAFLKWRNIFKTYAPTGTTAVVIDTISVNTVAFLYNSALQGQEGFGVAAALKSYIQPARNANSNLNRQCNDIETAFVNQYIAQRLQGRRLLTGQ